MSNTKTTISAQPLSPLYKLLGKTPAQVRQELIDQGLNPEAEIEAMRRLGRVMAAKYAPQIQREEAAMRPGSIKPFPVCEEAVAAGAPAWSESSAPAHQSTILDLLSSRNPSTTMWVPVTGWSMRDEGIKDGDLVLVDTNAEPKDGDIVVAHILGMGQVVKRLRIASDRSILLMSANPDFEPIEIEDNSTIRVHGVVIGRAGKI